MPRPETRQPAAGRKKGAADEGTRKPASERKKGDADAIVYAFGHWIRLEALAILAEGKFSVAEVARMIGISVPRLSGHINGLYDHGCIESMGEDTSGNANEHFYRAVVLPRIDDEKFREMSPVERRESLGIVTQAVSAETLASIRAGKLDDDENARVIGRYLCVDAQGKDEVQEHVLDVYGQLIDIKVKNAHRLSKSKKAGTTTIISVTGFERSRPVMPHTEKATARRIARGPGRKPVAKREKDIADAVAYAAGNRIRVDALGILAEGKISVAEVANLLGVDLKRFSDHVRHLYDYGCIEDVGTEKARNTNKHFYRAVTLPRISVDEYRSLSFEERRDVIGLIVQRVIVETLASFRSRKLENDERVQLIWDCLNLDGRGKQEVATCLTRADKRLLVIEALNEKRLAKSGESGTAMVASLIGFERSRPGRPDAGYDSPRKI
jgi:DNA-binding transcriptional ArsR family regulator